MYLGAMSCKITIADKYIINGLETYEEKKTVHQIVQQAKITLPLSYVIRNNNMAETVKLIDIIQEGDAINVAYGYNGNNINNFNGYIKTINAKQPLELELEDELYLLRKIKLQKSFIKNDVKDLIKYIVDELQKQCNVRLPIYNEMPQLTITNFVMDGTNGVAALQELSDSYGINCYLAEIDGITQLYCGLTYGLKHNYIKYSINANTINVDDLKFKGGATTTFKVKFIHHNPNGIVDKIEFGDKLGTSLNDVHIYGNFTQEEVKLQAQAHLDAYKTGGYKGSFETLLLPQAQPSDIAIISDTQFKGRTGNYYIATVTKYFGTGGGKQKIEIDFNV